MAKLLELVAFARFVCQLMVVKATVLPMTIDAQGERQNPVSIQRFLTAWVEAVNDFLQRQYRDVIQQGPSAVNLAQYQLECKWLLRSALKLESLVKDPEYPGRYFAQEIAGKLIQLQESWDSLNNPISDSETDAILQKVFPDEARAGKPA